jgi:hypothetical protein
MCLPLGQCAFLVSTDKPAVASYIGHENGHQPSLHSLTDQRSLPRASVPLAGGRLYLPGARSPVATRRGMRAAPASVWTRAAARRRARPGKHDQASSTAVDYNTNLFYDYVASLSLTNGPSSLPLAVTLPSLTRCCGTPGCRDRGSSCAACCG